MKKAVALYRASSRRQGKSGLGLEAQKTNVRRFAKFKKMKIIAEFTEVKSGLKKNRPIIDSVLKMCRETGATLLIANSDRLTRRLLFAELLWADNVDFVAVDRPDADRFELQITFAFAEKESRENGRRTREALQAAKERGVKLGTSIHGLLKKRRKKYKAFAIRMKPKIKKLMDKGYTTTRSLADALNTEGIKTFYGGQARWHLSTVHKLLKAI